MVLHNSIHHGHEPKQNHIAFAAARHEAMSLLFAVLAVLAVMVCATAAHAGPPFFTDDPVPVEYRHWEVYLATQDVSSKDGESGTAPHVEVNYGVVPEVQLHMILPMAWNRPTGGSTQYGFGDIELGVKYRFIHEGEWIPQAGTFPLAEIPTGDSSRGLGEGRVRMYFPLWLQKSKGPWTSYGGGGYWINPGDDNRNYWFAGWEVQRDFSRMVTIGAELFYATEDSTGAGDHLGFNVGGIVNLTDEHHLMCTGGRDLHGDNDFYFYGAYQYTFGPP